jgi:hypothetical protein
MDCLVRPVLVRPVTVGTLADTPTSVRLKVAEFQRLLGDTPHPVVIAELQRLAATYLEAANKLEAASRRSLKSKIEDEAELKRA